MIIHDYTYSRWLFHVISIVKYSLFMSNYHKLPEGSDFSPLVRFIGDVGRATGCTGPAGSTFFALTALEKTAIWMSKIRAVLES